MAHCQWHPVCCARLWHTGHVLSFPSQTDRLLMWQDGLSKLLDVSRPVLFIANDLCSTRQIFQASRQNACHLGSSIITVRHHQGQTSHLLSTCNGFAGFVRHPMYAGLLYSAWGLAAASANPARLILALALTLLLNKKVQSLWTPSQEFATLDASTLACCCLSEEACRINAKMSKLNLASAAICILTVQSSSLLGRYWQQIRPN